MIDPSGLHMPRSQQKNIPKGFLTLIIMIVFGFGLVALLVYAVYVSRVHPEWLDGQATQEKSQTI